MTGAEIDLIGADVLRDAARLARRDVGIAQGIQEGGLAVVDMAHHGHHGCPRPQILRPILDPFEADLDVRGALGLTGADRRGFRRIRISLRVGGDAPERELRGIVALARRRSAVLDLVTNGVRVDVEVQT